MLFEQPVQPLRIHAFIKFDPQQKTALRAANPGAARKIFHHPVSHGAQIALVLVTYPAHVLQIMPLFDEIRDSDLWQRSRGAGGDVFHVQRTVVIATRRDPADA